MSHVVSVRGNCRLFSFRLFRLFMGMVYGYVYGDRLPGE